MLTATASLIFSQPTKSAAGFRLSAHAPTVSGRTVISPRHLPFQNTIVPPTSSGLPDKPHKENHQMRPLKYPEAHFVFLQPMPECTLTHLHSTTPIWPSHQTRS